MVPWIPEAISSLFSGRERELEEEDFVTKTSNFIDNHLQAFRTGTLLLAGTGVLIIIRRTHLFSWFRNASAIPKEFLTKGISLRGQVQAVTESSNTLEVLHIPLIRTSKYSKYKESHESSSGLLSLAFAGVEFRDGSNQWLNNNLLNSNIKFIPLCINQDSQISCIIYNKRSYFLRSLCVNEELVRQGLAVTGNYDKSLEHNESFKKLFSRLFTAEAYALRKHRGIWAEPTILEKIRRAQQTILEKIRSITIPVPSVLIWSKKKITKVENKTEKDNEKSIK